MAKAVAKKTPAKKAAPKKTAASKSSNIKEKKKEATIKYSDKSEGQPKLVPIFKELVKLMEPFEKGTLKKSGGKDGQVSLVSKKQVEIAGKKMEEVWFSGALVQKGYVGFYFMPVYTSPELKKELHPDLLKCLKGKSCFHIKKMDEEISEQIKEALEIGFEHFSKKGWIS